MKRAGFTMIELIFVIVILGILAAVALPKFIGVSEQAEAAKCKALVGTLNRTVGPAIWSNGVLNDQNFTSAADITRVTTEITDQITIPPLCGTAIQYATAIAGGADFSVPVGKSTYDVNGTDANVTNAPIWGWTKQ